MFFLGPSANILFYGLIWAIVMICCQLGNKTSKEYDIDIDSFTFVVDAQKTEVYSSTLLITFSDQEICSDITQQIVYPPADKAHISIFFNPHHRPQVPYNRDYLVFIIAGTALRAPPALI